MKPVFDFFYDMVAGFGRAVDRAMKGIDEFIKEGKAQEQHIEDDENGEPTP